MELELLRVKEPEGKTRITSADMIYDLMKEESRADRECMFVIHLNAQKQVLKKELVSMGTVSEAVTSPREIFRRAIIEGSSSIIIVHNHPSGVTDPSYQDKHLEEVVRQVGSLIKIPLLDFIIIGDGYYSSKEEKVNKKNEGKSKGDF